MDAGTLTGIAAIILALVAIYNGIQSGKKTSSSAAGDVVAAAIGLVGPLRERLAIVEGAVKTLTDERDTLKSQVSDRDQKITRLEAKVELLTTQIIALGHKPIDIGQEN